jgi:hypothetical protein
MPVRTRERDATNERDAELTIDAAKAKVVTLTFSTDTSAYASGDLIADSQELANAVRLPAECSALQSIQLLDKADQKVELYIVFINADQSLGSENSAPNITDANSEKIIGWVKIATTDYLDVGGASVASKNGIGLLLKAAAAQTSIWVAILNSTGSPTYGAADLIGQFAFLRE